MAKIGVFLFLLFSIQVNGDLLDEAKEAVENLRIYMTAQISDNLYKVDNLVQDLLQYQNQVTDKATIDVTSGHQGYVSTLEMYKELAESLGGFMSCFDKQKENLDILLQATLESFPVCGDFANGEMSSIQDDAVYRLNILINDVEYYNYQVQRCGDNILCLSPILDQIELAMVNFPQKVDVEINKASQLTDDLKITVQDCIDPRIAAMLAKGKDIVSLAFKCVPPQNNK